MKSTLVNSSSMLLERFIIVFDFQGTIKPHTFSHIHTREILQKLYIIFLVCFQILAWNSGINWSLNIIINIDYWFSCRSEVYKVRTSNNVVLFLVFCIFHWYNKMKKVISLYNAFFQWNLTSILRTYIYQITRNPICFKFTLTVVYRKKYT